MSTSPRQRTARVCVVCERLDARQDEGIKNIARAFLTELAKDNEVRGLSERADIPELGVERFEANRYYLSASLRRRLRRFGPDVLIYIPWSSATVRSLFRLRILKAYTGARTALVATQPGDGPRILDLLARFLLPDRVFVQGETERRRMETMGAAVGLMPSGINLERFRPARPGEREQLRARFGLPTNRPVLLHVGHLKPERIELAILREVCRRNLGEVLVVGSCDTPQSEEVIGRLQKAGVRVFRDYISDIEALYRAVDCYMFPVISARDSVGVPLSVLEAMATNLPVVSTSFEGLPLFLEAGGGLLFCDSPQSFSDGVEKVLEADRIETREKVTPYSWAAVVGSIWKRIETEPDR